VTWAAPWALIGLVGLPLAWWWHRRRRRPRTVDLSSLLFLQPELDARPAHRRVFDPELLLALVAILLLVLAAARPALVIADEGRTLRVVVSKGAPATAWGYEERVSRVLDRLRERLGPADDLVVVEEPAGGDDLQPRPSPSMLLAAALGGDAAVRVVISDRDAPSETAGVTWIAVGDPDTFNVGIVAATVALGEIGLEIFVNVRGDDRRDTPLVFRTWGDGKVVHESGIDVPAGGFASRWIGIPGSSLDVTVELRRGDGETLEDFLSADDRVTWTREAVAVHLADDLPDRLRQAVEDALLARFGPGGFRLAAGDAALAVTTSATAATGAAWVVVLHPAEAGAAQAPPGVDHALEEALVADLGTGEVGLVYADGVPDAEVGRVLLWRDAGGRRWPVVAREGRTVHFLPDPTRGRPPPAAMPLWPLLLDNVLDEVTGGKAGDGVVGRRVGLLDPESSRLGRVATPIEIPSLAAGPADRPARLAGAASPRRSRSRPSRPARRTGPPGCTRSGRGCSAARS
jgi:hypothetical protein